MIPEQKPDGSIYFARIAVFYTQDTAGEAETSNEPDTQDTAGEAETINESVTQDTAGEAGTSS